MPRVAIVASNSGRGVEKGMCGQKKNASADVVD